MKLSAYLSRSRHGVFYFRWPLPSPGRQSRSTVRISLRTKCPDRAGVLARYLASCGRLIRGNSDLAGLRQHEIREKVQAYFKAQLDQYLDWLDRRGLSQTYLADAREEMRDHESFLAMERAYPQWLPVARFKRTMKVSDAEWNASLPRIALELRKGRRDMLSAVLAASERLGSYSFDQPTQTEERPSGAALRLWARPSRISKPSSGRNGRRRCETRPTRTLPCWWSTSGRITPWTRSAAKTPPR